MKIRIGIVYDACAKRSFLHCDIAKKDCHRIQMKKELDCETCDFKKRIEHSGGYYEEKKE